MNNELVEFDIQAQYKSFNNPSVKCIIKKTIILYKIITFYVFIINVHPYIKRFNEQHNIFLK